MGKMIEEAREAAVTERQQTAVIKSMGAEAWTSSGH
jgi:hypothetical protein